MENKNEEVRFVLEMVIGDYMGVLRDSVDEDEDGITLDQWYQFVDGIFEIGKVFDINVCDLDQGELVPVLLTREKEQELIKEFENKPVTKKLVCCYVGDTNSECEVYHDARCCMGCPEKDCEHECGCYSTIEREDGGQAYVCGYEIEV